MSFIEVLDAKIDTRHYINGLRVASEQTFTNTSPIDGSFLGEISRGTKVEVDLAVAAAKAADVALLYIALPTFKESEGYDRADLDLTAHQVALIQAVTVAQPASVVILNNGSAVTMSAWKIGRAHV